MKKIVIILVFVLAVVNVTSADVFDEGGANEFTIDFVTISGDASSANGTNIGDYKPEGFVDPTNDYRIGKYEITNDQFAKFASNVPYYTDGSVSANNISWFEAAQFTNYLNTITGNDVAYKFNGGTFDVWTLGDEGYDASNPFRNSNAKYFMPTEDEWVKAAYWNGTNVQTYANASPSDLVSGEPDPAKWNYNPSAGDEPWDVGSGSEELNGTYDMMGNFWEWMESPYFSGDYLSGSLRVFRGGACGNDLYAISSSSGNYYYPYDEYLSIGFRVASIPEPGSLIMICGGCLFLRRKRK